MNNLIESIESMCNESEQNATAILAKIKAAIQNSKKPDFSKIKDGKPQQAARLSIYSLTITSTTIAESVENTVF